MTPSVSGATTFLPPSMTYSILLLWKVHSVIYCSYKIGGEPEGLVVIGSIILFLVFLSQYGSTLLGCGCYFDPYLRRFSSIIFYAKNGDIACMGTLIVSCLVFPCEKDIDLGTVWCSDMNSPFSYNFFLSALHSIFPEQVFLHIHQWSFDPLRRIRSLSNLSWDPRWFF